MQKDIYIIIHHIKNVKIENIIYFNVILHFKIINMINTLKYEFYLIYLMLLICMEHRKNTKTFSYLNYEFRNIPFPDKLLIINISYTKHGLDIFILEYIKTMSFARIFDNVLQFLKQKLFIL